MRACHREKNGSRAPDFRKNEKSCHGAAFLENDCNQGIFHRGLSCPSAIATGAWREGAVHSHTRRALAAGCTSDEIRHVVLLATTTLGFPSMMAVWTWVEDVLGRK